MEERSFKELLEYYIRESGYTNYDFAKETGINRVNIQRYLAGTRVPNQQTFDTIKNNLRLNAVEVKLFTEQYRLAFYGEDFYFQRKEVKEILEKAADICTVEPRLPQAPENRQTEIIETVRGSVAVERFVKTGLCEDYPEEYVRPLSRKERAEMLGRICRSIEEENREIGLINRQDLNLSKSLGVFVSGGAGLNLILYDEKTGFRHLLIKEESLIQSFEAYIKSMKENGEVYPKEKSLEILRQYQADLERL